MSRSDFWPVAITLIVAGAVYFVGGRTAAYVCIALGAAIVLYLLLTHKKKSLHAPASVTVNPQISANPQMIANPSVHVHLPGSEKPERAPQPPQPSKPKPQHNLGLHSCKMARIVESVDRNGDLSGFHLTEDQSKLNAAIVCIKNKSKEGEVGYIEDVRAALTFRANNGHEIGAGISRGCWLNNQLRNASFDLEETKCVIVAVMLQDDDGKAVGATAPYIRERMTEYGKALTLDAYELNEDPGTVEVILLAKNSRVIEPMTFELFNENGKAGIRLVTEE